jgi:hypothetical protein
MPRVILLALLLLPLAGTADQVFRTTDEQGNVVFTDAPPAGVNQTEQVELQPTNTTPPPPERQAPAEASQVKEVKPYYSLKIAEPANETSIPMGPGNFSVSVIVQPELRGKDRFQLFMDGEPREAPQRATRWDLTNVFRGEHNITVSILNAEGKTVASSNSIQVFVHRPSIHFRNRK